MRKPVFCLCENRGADQLCSNCSLRENFKTAAGQLSDRLKIFAGQKKKLSDRKNDQKKKNKPEDQWSCKRSPEISCIYQ